MSDMPSLDMADAKSNSLILEAFDLFLSDVNTALAIKSFLEEENKALKYEVDLLTAEAKKKDEILAGKEEEIGRLLERNLSSTRSHTLIISETKNEIRASAQLVEMRYEVEILLSNQRAHARELNAQRTENERLLRSNQQLTRDLNMVRAQCLDLEKSAASKKNTFDSKTTQGQVSNSRQQHQGGEEGAFANRASSSFNSNSFR